MMIDTFSVSTDRNVGFPIDVVWGLLSDPERMAGLGPENIAARWVSDT